MNVTRCKRRTLIDIYYTYKYKKNITHSLTTIPFPYIKKSECTDHQYSADWKEWLYVVTAYIEKLKIQMEEGHSVTLGSKMGDFILTKIKSDRFLDFKKSKEAGKQIYFKYNNVDNYYIASSWIKSNHPFKLRSYWKITLNRFWVRSIYERCANDYTKIYKIRNAR